MFGGNRNNNSFGIIGTILMVILAPLAAMIVQMAISRTREYAADRGGAEICGNPMWLASALARIDAAAHQIPNDNAERNPATAHMFIINPLSGHRMDNLFSTHPAPENRIAALQPRMIELRPRVWLYNAQFFGSPHEALGNSLNIPAVKAMAVNGPDHVFAKAQEFGMTFQTQDTFDIGPIFSIDIRGRF